MWRNKVVAFVFLASAASIATAQTQPSALASAWVLPPPAQPAPAQIIAVRAGRLFDPKSGTLLANQVVLIRGDRITDVGASLQIPAGARVIDLSRATVLPGLIDTHLHVMDGNPLTAPGGPGIVPGAPNIPPTLQYRELIAVMNAQRDLSAGFTTIVDLMSHGGWYGTVDLRNAINNGLVQRTAHAGGWPRDCRHQQRQRSVPAASHDADFKPRRAIANGPWAVREAVREQAHYGVDWIKIYSTEEYYFKPDGTMVNTPSFTLEETQAIVDEAHRKGLKVACHAYGGEGLHNCIAAGVDVPTHGVDLDDAVAQAAARKHLPLTSRRSST